MLINIYVTFPNLKTAKKIASVLLKKRLIACVNFFPIKSNYWWQGKIVKDSEIMAIYKTSSKNWLKVQREIKKRHSYTVSAIEKIEVKTDENYERWVKEVTR
ncbi:MAG TPA: divalent cation tolerance protein CutA [Patescibacteria group bacterium]|nr:divalent cation tolerance protein CutA [Patescibacteria group bacterium]